MRVETPCPWCNHPLKFDTQLVNEGFGGVCLKCTLPIVFDAELRAQELTPAQFNQLSGASQAKVMEQMKNAHDDLIAREGWTGWPEFFEKMKRYLLLVLLILGGCRSVKQEHLQFPPLGCDARPARPYRLEMREGWISQRQERR